MHQARFPRLGPDRPTEEGGASFSHEASNWVKTGGVSPDVAKLQLADRTARLLQQTALDQRGGMEAQKGTEATDKPDLY